MDSRQQLAQAAIVAHNVVIEQENAELRARVAHLNDYVCAMHEQQIADLRRDREELDARVAQLEGAIDALFTVADEPGAFNRGDAAWAQLRAVRYGNATPTDRTEETP